MPEIGSSRIGLYTGSMLLPQHKGGNIKSQFSRTNASSFAAPGKTTALDPHSAAPLRTAYREPTIALTTC